MLILEIAAAFYIVQCLFGFIVLWVGD